MPDTSYILLAAALAASITLLLRSLPFVLKNAIKDSPLLHALNGWMPLGIMVILMVYCLSMIRPGNGPLATAQLVASVVTLLLHYWRRNLFLSVLAGTGTCVLLANGVLPAA
ncbi:MAG: branched-chain amino acid ABC transporter [Gammaproteobacteria bacterium]|nr:branched-chain amino acid ABC transporter [Gammaproteobacteria bacterium]